MPRGGDNPGRGMLMDVEGNRAFQQQILNQYGVMPNAEAMIRAHRASRDPALAAALLAPVDVEATEEVQEDLAAAGAKLGLTEEDGTILSASVRGHALVVVVEPETGAARKVCGPYDDKYEAPKLTPQRQMEEAEYERERVLAEETARLRAQAEIQLAEHRKGVDEWLNKQVAEIQENAEKALAEALANAQVEVDKAEKKDPTPPRSGPVYGEANLSVDVPTPESTPPVDVPEPGLTAEVEQVRVAISETVPAPAPGTVYNDPADEEADEKAEAEPKDAKAEKRSAAAARKSGKE